MLVFIGILFFGGVEMLYSTYTVGGVLVHHGIHGQKWGVHNGPPYPLDVNDHSAAEKKHLSEYGLSKEEKYRQREATATKKYYDREINRSRKKEKKLQDKFIKNSEKFGSDMDKATSKNRSEEATKKAVQKICQKYGIKQMKVQEKINDQIRAQNYVNELMNTELGKIKVMDVKQDKINKAKYIAKESAKAAASMAVVNTGLRMVGAPVVYVCIPAGSYRRTSNEERQEIYNRHYQTDAQKRRNVRVQYIR